MRGFLLELQTEVSHISSKSLSPIGFDYRGRTKLERLLFLILKKYCNMKWEYDLGGLTYSHQKAFLEFAKASSCDSENVEIVSEGFRISELVWQLSSSNPYIREEAMQELGGTVQILFKNLADRIASFIIKVENSYQVS